MTMKESQIILSTANPEAELMKKRKLALLKEKANRYDNLPHLYGKKFYTWSRKFYESKNRFNLLCSGNQIGKSSFLIRRAIHRATCPEKWHEWWPSKPTMFWYFYPSKSLGTIEFENKWIKEWLPRGAFKKDP